MWHYWRLLQLRKFISFFAFLNPLINIFILGCGLCVSNFSSAQTTTTINTQTISFYIGIGAVPEGDGLATTHGDALNLPIFPAGISPILGEGAMADSFAATSMIRNENREIVGIATEIEYFPNGVGVDVGVGLTWGSY